MDIKKYCHKILFLLTCIPFLSYAQPPIELQRIKEGYPESIRDINSSAINWNDGTSTSIRGSSPLMEKLLSLFTRIDPAKKSISLQDFRCDNYEPFFRKMYGNSLPEVKSKLVTVYWLPHVFGKRYPLRVTTVNGVDKKIARISAELEKLPPSYYKYLASPAGAFYWRNVKNEKYLSAHSFGIALDINAHYGSYWMWDLEKMRGEKKIVYHNNIPMRIVEIFENEGFLWGGRWYYYDTMHFEYRPELFAKTEKGLEYHNQLGLRCDI